MNTIETITQKVVHLPPNAREEVLDAVKEIEKRYTKNGDSNNEIKESAHALDLLAEIQLEDAPEDLAERHDFYANKQLED